MKKFGLYSSVALSSLCLLSANPAFAQQTATPAADAVQDGGIQDIIVTAQRRSENMQRVPISVVAITASDLTKKGLRSLDNLAYATPALNITHTQSAAKPFLRGEGSQDAAISNESSVAIYIDDVYLYNPYGLFFSFNNIQQVEVLKGPQGTLYGRNAVGGLINIRTKDPSHTTHVDLTAGYGNWRTKQFTGYATTGLGETLAADIAVRYYDQGKGFGLNYPGVPTTPGTLAGTPIRVHKTKEFSVRSKWIWEPTSATKVTFTADYEYANSDAGTLRHPPIGAVISAGLPYIGETFCGVDCYQNDQAGTAINKGYGTSLRIDQDFDVVNFTSITGYRSTINHNTIDQDDSPRLRLTVAPTNITSEMFSQELQLKSPSSSKFKWIVGAFYMKASGHYDPIALRGIVASGLPGTTPPGGYDLYAAGRTESRAVFGQVSAPLLPKLTATLGARYTSDKVKDNGRLFSVGLGFNASAVFPATPLCGPTFVGVIPAGTNACVISQSNTFKKVTWRGALDYQVTDDFLAYISLSRGFKAGVYNLTRYMDVPVKPQTLDALEVGTKMDMFDRHVRLNTSIYYYRDKGIQLTQNNGSTNILTNAAKGRNYGGEIELTVVPVERLNLTAGAAYTHARYRTFPGAPNTQPAPIPPGGNVQTLINAAGNQYLQAPKVTMNLSADYVIPSSMGDFDLNTSYYYNDGFFWEANNRLRQKDYGILNMSLTWTAPSKTFDVRLWVNNLTNKRYTIFGSTSPTGDQVADSDPRMFGATLGVHF
jgi:iron complex outermembrane receptor protein